MPRKPSPSKKPGRKPGTPKTGGRNPGSAGRKNLPDLNALRAIEQCRIGEFSKEEDAAAMALCTHLHANLRTDLPPVDRNWAMGMADGSPDVHRYQIGEAPPEQARAFDQSCVNRLADYLVAAGPDGIADRLARIALLFRCRPPSPQPFNPPEGPLMPRPADPEGFAAVMLRIEATMPQTLALPVGHLRVITHEEVLQELEAMPGGQKAQLMAKFGANIATDRKEERRGKAGKWKAVEVLDSRSARRVSAEVNGTLPKKPRRKA